MASKNFARYPAASGLRSRSGYFGGVGCCGELHRGISYTGDFSGSVGFDLAGKLADVGALRVQVGSFSDQQNALNLLERAKPFYPVGRVQVVDLPEGKRYRVQIGQFSREAQAEAAASHLESLLGLQAFVFRDDS